MTNPKLAGRLVANVLERRHRPFDSLASHLGDEVRPVEHVGDGADGHAREVGDIADPGPVDHQLETT